VTTFTAEALADRWTPPRSTLISYSIAFVALVIAIAVRFLLDPWMGDSLPLVTLFGAIAIAVWVGGYRPAIVAAAAGYLACNYFFIPPRGTLLVITSATAVGAAAYVLTSAIIIAFGEALRRSRRRADREREMLRVTLASMGDAVITTDDAGRVTSLNEAAETLTGWSSADAAGRHVGAIFKIIHEDTRAPAPDPVAQALRDVDATSLVGHAVLVAKDGSERPIDDSAAPIRDRDGNVIGCALIFRDIAERRRSEQALSRSEQEFRDFFDNATIGLHWVGPDGVILRVNQAELDMLGYTRDELVGRNIAEFHVDEAAIDDLLARLRSGEAVHDEPARLRCKDGSFRDVMISSSALFEDGQFVHTRCFTVDVTERIRAERELRAGAEELRQNEADAHLLQRLSAELVRQDDEQALYDQIVDAASAIMRSQFSSFQRLEISEEGREELLLLAFRGFTAEAAEGWRRLGDDADTTCGRALRLRQRVVSADVSHDPEMAGTATLQAYLDTGILSVQSTPLFSRSGRLVGMISTHWNRPHEPSDRDFRNFDILARQAADLMERKQAADRERELVRKTLAATAKFESVFNQSGIFAGVMDLSGYLREINDLAVDFCGYTRAEVLHLPFWKTPWWRHSEAMQARIRVATKEAAAGRIFREVLQYWDAAGNERQVDFAIFPIRDAGGAVIFLHPTGIDITDQRRAEDALLDADRRKDEFLATLAHELRNPLAPIRNALQVLQIAGNDPATLEQARSMMERQLGQMVRLIDDLLDVSRISRGKLPLKLERVELASIIRQAIETCQPVAESSGHDITVTMPMQPVYVLADPIRLAQVFSNLLNNACKFTDPSGRIVVTAEVDGGDLVASVRDNGIGIPREKLGGIFDMFVQVDQSLERSNGGLGLGLTLVKRLVELHDGTIEARSEGAGYGSEFILRLPIVIAKPLSTQTTELAPHPAGGRRVLIVDDNRDSAESLAMLMKLTGNETYTANDGQSALIAADELRPDLMLLDIGLPMMNGYEVCRLIREESWGQKIVIIALTGWGQEEDKRRSGEAGFDGHLVKPVDPTALEGVLADLTAQREQRVEESPSSAP
jgi:PAS domain S-box-containing protein